MDQKPQRFDADRAAILCNMAELVVRELEAAWAAQYQRQHSLKLLRAMSCYSQAFLVVDTAQPGWAVLHANEALTEQTGARCSLYAGILAALRHAFVKISQGSILSACGLSSPYAWALCSSDGGGGAS